MEDHRAEYREYCGAGRRRLRVPAPGLEGFRGVTYAAVRRRRLIHAVRTAEDAVAGGGGPLQRRPQDAGQGPGSPEGGGPGRKREGSVEAGKQGAEGVREGDLPVPDGDREESQVLPSPQRPGVCAAEDG